jgi:hypothetical protein
MRKIPLNNKKHKNTKEGQAWALRIKHVPQKGKRSPYYIIGCGCGCEKKIKIYYDDDKLKDMLPSAVDIYPENLEIDGVHTTIDEWRRVLLPLLEGNEVTKERDRRVKKKLRDKKERRKKLKFLEELK